MVMADQSPHHLRVSMSVFFLVLGQFPLSESNNGPSGHSRDWLRVRSNASLESGRYLSVERVGK